MTIDVVIETPEWQTAGLESLAERAADATLAHLKLDGAAFEICLLGCGDARIAALNAAFREKPQATNVLSWPSEERGADAPGGVPAAPGDVELGDIAIAYQTCAREAAELARPFDAHVTHLVVHGVLHLLGYDHIDGQDAALMEGLETEILATLGLPDPYGT
ncbi:MAG: rRNA maturation RNase YbeY [Rhodobacter sp.]|nr:rRNA maturation RNase YbeY [Rhodobacter sp.]